ncbi:MAG: Lsr2 family DNA-binding protein [Frankiaceae bacterium]
MQVTIDSSEPLERVLPVVAALYGVELTVSAGQAGPSRPGSSTEPPRPARRSRRKAKIGVPAAPSRRTRKAKPDAAALRTWARANGHDVKDRGRVPAAVITAYLADETR